MERLLQKRWAGFATFLFNLFSPIGCGKQESKLTRMHSSRMRTARLRIVTGGGGGCCDHVPGGGGGAGRGVLSTWSQGGGRCCDLVLGGEGGVVTWSQGEGGVLSTWSRGWGGVVTWSRGGVGCCPPGPAGRGEGVL